MVAKVLLCVFNYSFLSLSCLICCNVTWCPHDAFLKYIFLIWGRSMCCLTWQEYFWLHIVIWSSVEFWRCASHLNILYCVYLTRGGFGFFAIQDLFALSPSEQRHIFVFTSTLRTFRAQKLINLKCEWCTLLFYKGMFKCLEEILTRAKSKWELEWRIFLFTLLKKITLQFGLVWNWKMCSRFFQCWF